MFCLIPLLTVWLISPQIDIFISASLDFLPSLPPSSSSLSFSSLTETDSVLLVLGQDVQESAWKTPYILWQHNRGR